MQRCDCLPVGGVRVTYGDGVHPTPARSRNARRRVIRLTALTAAATLALPLLGTGPAAAVAPSLPAADVPPALSAFYAQTLAWAPCGDDMTCSWLTVPRDYSQPDGATIRIRVSRVAASDPAARQGAVVVNPGGPGASGLDMPSYVAGAIAPDVAREFDIVGFDTRGVGRSAPITCMTGAQTTRWLRADGAPDTRAEQARLMSLGARLARGCLSMSPQIARHVGTEDTVRDLDILRAALGEARLNWLGYSYGTYVGTLYAETFPETVGRFVLDGALDPSLDIMEVSRGQSRGFQVAMTRFAADCSTRSTCPFAGGTKAVLAGVNRILAQVDSDPLPAGEDGDLVQGEALSALFYAMYSPVLWSPLRQALKQAKAGNGLGLQLIADYANERTGPTSYATNMASAFPAISCWDTPAAPGASGLRAAARAWSRGAPVPDMARALAWGNAPCSHWYGHSARLPAPASSTTTAPILVVGTTYDPATPYTWAQALHRQLATSTLLTYVGDGHTAFGAGSDCIDDAVTGFLLTGTPPAPGTTCH